MIQCLTTRGWDSWSALTQGFHPGSGNKTIRFQEVLRFFVFILRFLIPFQELFWNLRVTTQGSSTRRSLWILWSYDHTLSEKDDIMLSFVASAYHLHKMRDDLMLTTPIIFSYHFEPWSVLSEDSRFQIARSANLIGWTVLTNGFSYLVLPIHFWHFGPMQKAALNFLLFALLFLIAICSEVLCRLVIEWGMMFDQ